MATVLLMEIIIITVMISVMITERAIVTVKVTLT